VEAIRAISKRLWRYQSIYKMALSRDSGVAWHSVDLLYFIHVSEKSMDWTSNS
jgi:hypothetical protein